MILPVATGAFSIGNDIDVYCDNCVRVRVQQLERDSRALHLRERFQNLRARGLVTEELRQASFRNSRAEIEAMNPKAWKAGRGWVPTRNLYIHGPTGVGKSRLARCCLNWQFQQGRDVAEATARRFCKTADTFNEGGGLFTAWKNTPVFLLDDIDKASWTPDRIGALWELLDSRATGQRRTIVTGNVSPKELQGLLRECGKGKVITNTTHTDATLERLRPSLTLHMQGESQR